MSRLSTPSSRRFIPAAHADCVVFLSHHIRPGAMRSLASMTRALAGCFDVVPIFDQTHGAYPVADAAPDGLCVTASALEAALPYVEKCRQHPGTLWPNNIDLPLFWFWAFGPRYRHYWLIEYDVRFSGDWKDFFCSFSENGSDLLATTMFDYEFRPDWAHWGTFRSTDPVPLSDRVRATLSACRMSARALVAVDDAYRRGCSGHYEVTIPTVLKHRACTIEDIGGNGRYVAPDNVDRFYTNSPRTPGLAPGTFVLHPAGMLKETLPNKLWNPVKD